MSDFESDATISLTLSNNRIVLKENGLWTVEDSDVDRAANCISDLVSQLEKSQLQIEILKNELRDSNHAKTATLQMVVQFELL